MTGWQDALLGELCTIQSGSSNTQDADPNGEFAFFDRSKTPKRSNRYLLDCEAVIIAGEGAEFRPKKYVGKFDLHQRAYAIHGFGGQLLGDYLFYYLEHVHTYFQKVAVGATVKSLRQRHFENLPVTFPKLIAEQQRIVGILDQAFEGIAKAKANAERNLVNAKELSRSFLESLVAADGAAWKEEHLEDLVTDDCSLSYGIVQPGDEFEGGIPIVRPTDMSAKHIGLDGLKRVNPKVTYAYERTNLRGGELLLCVRGTTGLVSIAEAELSGSNVTRGIVPMRFDENRIDGEYAFYAFISDYVQRQIKSKTYGSTLMQINIRDVRKIKIPLPDRNKQKGIAMRCREVLDLSDEMYRNSHQKIEQIGTLQQALLSQAFSGNL